MINIIHLEMSKRNSGSSVPGPRSQSRDLRLGLSTPAPHLYPTPHHQSPPWQRRQPSSCAQSLLGAPLSLRGCGLHSASLTPGLQERLKLDAPAGSLAVSLPQGSANQPAGPIRPATCPICSLALHRRACGPLASGRAARRRCEAGGGVMCASACVRVRARVQKAPERV